MNYPTIRLRLMHLTYCLFFSEYTRQLDQIKNSKHTRVALIFLIISNEADMVQQQYTSSGRSINCKRYGIVCEIKIHLF